MILKFFSVNGVWWRKNKAEIGTRKEPSGINDTITASESQDNTSPNIRCLQGFFPLSGTTTVTLTTMRVSNCNVVLECKGSWVQVLVGYDSFSASFHLTSLILYNNFSPNQFDNLSYKKLQIGHT